MIPDQYQKALEQLKAFLKDPAGKNLPPLLAEPKAAEDEEWFPLNWNFHKHPDKLAVGKAFGYGDYPEDGQTDFYPKGIEEKDRYTHFYAVGATGHGKSTLLESMIIQDIVYGKGFGVIDPHGDLVAHIKGWIYYWGPPDFNRDIVLIDASDPENTATFNPLELVDGFGPEELALQLVEAFKKIWADAWGERMAGIMRNSLIALAENNLTLLELPLFLTNATVRKRILLNVKSVTCRQQFAHYDQLGAKTWNEWTESTLNKIDAFLSNPKIRQIFASPKSSFSLRDIMDNGKILLVSFNKGRLNESANLIGALLISKIQMAVLSRSEQPEDQRKRFYLYVDEFQNFATKSFIDILSEARKYKLSLILAHQNLSQLPDDLRDSILANCGIQACFRVNRIDAQILAKEMMSPLYRHTPGWEMDYQMLQDLKKHHFYIANRNKTEVVGLETLCPPLPREMMLDDGEPWEQETFDGLIRDLGIGKDYLRNRQELERESIARANRLSEVSEPDDFRESRE